MIAQLMQIKRKLEALQLERRNAQLATRTEREWCDAANTLQEAKDIITRFHHNNTGAQEHA